MESSGSRAVDASMPEGSILDALTVAAEPFAFCELGPGVRLPMPPGPGATLHYVLSGSGVFSAHGRAPEVLAEGALLFVPAGLRHAVTGAGGAARPLPTCRPAALGLRHHREAGDAGRLSLLCARVEIGLGGSGAVADLVGAPILQSGPAAAEPQRALDLLVGELAEPRPGSRAMIRALLVECFIGLLRRGLDAGSDSLARLPALLDRRLWPAVQAMLDRPGEPHSVESLAALAALSRSSFAARFQSVYGTGPMTLLRDLRLARAANFLATSRDGVERIAALCGYASRSYFSRQFETRYGVPPARYRRDARG